MMPHKNVQDHKFFAQKIVLIQHLVKQVTVAIIVSEDTRKLVNSSFNAWYVLGSLNLPLDNKQFWILNNLVAYV